MAFPNLRSRASVALISLLLLLHAPSVQAGDGDSFDLAGPGLRVTVTHGGVTLPLSQVPNLSAGDRVTVQAALPAEQGARYRMVLAFMRGATNPPPAKWLFEARTWKAKDAVIDAIVPEGAEQALVFLVPDTGGAFNAVESAVRQRPGAFVRASQDLNQAMLDRTRLETFLGHIRERSSEEVARISPVLAKSLGVKLDPACLRKGQDPRAACLPQGQNAAVLADAQTSSIAQTLAGAPATIALQLAATPQAGFGYYSAYIGVVRDVARMFGAFQSAQLRFIPALNVHRGEETDLLLNAIPSFRKPQSVLVAALPTVASPTLPPLEADGARSLCLARPGLVLPVSGAPLAYTTAYARQMRLRVKTTSAMVDLPLRADATQGGFVVGGDRAALPAGLVAEGEVQGLWGFAAFNGPRFRLVVPGKASWDAGDATLVAGRDTPIALTGGAADCVSDVLLETSGAQRAVPFGVDGEGRLSLKVPLTGIKPGPVALAIRSHGVAEPHRLKLRAYAEASRIEGFVLHEGDRRGVLSGARLDQVATLELGDVTFRPGELTRAGSSDRLELAADAAQWRAGQTLSARVTLADGRSQRFALKIAPPRPDATLISRSIEPLAPQAVVMTLSDPGLIPQAARVTFSLRAQPGTRFAPDDLVEVKAAAGAVRLPLRLQDEGVALATLEPTKLGESVRGPLQYRIVQGGVAGDWRPLATLVRLPQLTALSCAAETCWVEGSGLFLLRAAGGVAVPDGFTGSAISFPRSGTSATLTLRDDAKASATIDLPAAQ